MTRWLRGHPEIPEPERNVKVGGWEIGFHHDPGGVAADLLGLLALG